MARFLPESVKDGLAHEFERLEQTEGMSVSEYSARFTQLSRHAPYHITEEMRIKKFIRGLREYLFRSVCGQEGHIKKNCPVVMPQPSSSHASAPTALAASQVPSAPMRQTGNSSVQGAGASQHEGRRSGGKGQMQGGRGQARVFALTRQDVQASNAVVTGILSICSQDAHVLKCPHSVKGKCCCRCFE
ncbi:hypothetical protein QL285_028096 [Trifolium repens]|nr:hypothetical protein QL285_028096 [Trifolium repens]